MRHRTSLRIEAAGRPQGGAPHTPKDSPHRPLDPSVMLRATEQGLYCEAGDFHVDPWAPVDRAVITHAHGDHAVGGSRAYLASHDTAALLRVRLGPDSTVESVDWRQTTTIGGVTISLHPAGHILGSSQIRLVYRGETWV